MMPKVPNGGTLASEMATKSHHWCLWGSPRALPRWLWRYILAIVLNFLSLWHPLASILGAQGVPQELCWRHKLAPRLIKAYLAATLFYNAFKGGIWRTIGSSLDHTFNNLFICKSVHLVGCPSQRTHCCIKKISKYTSLETRVSRTRKKIVD